MAGNPCQTSMQVPKILLTIATCDCHLYGVVYLHTQQEHY